MDIRYHPTMASITADQVREHLRSQREESIEENTDNTSFEQLEMDSYQEIVGFPLLGSTLYPFTTHTNPSHPLAHAFQYQGRVFEITRQAAQRASDCAKAASSIQNRYNSGALSASQAYVRTAEQARMAQQAARQAQVALRILEADRAALSNYTGNANSREASNAVRILVNAAHRALHGRKHTQTAINSASYARATANATREVYFREAAGQGVTIRPIHSVGTGAAVSNSATVPRQRQLLSSFGINGPLLWFITDQAYRSLLFTQIAESSSAFAAVASTALLDYVIIPVGISAGIVAIELPVAGAMIFAAERISEFRIFRYARCFRENNSVSPDPFFNISQSDLLECLEGSEAQPDFLPYFETGVVEQTSIESSSTYIDFSLINFSQAHTQLMCEPVGEGVSSYECSLIVTFPNQNQETPEQ